MRQWLRGPRLDSDVLLGSMDGWGRPWPLQHGLLSKDVLLSGFPTDLSAASLLV